MPVTPINLVDNAEIASIEPAVILGDYGMVEDSKTPSSPKIGQFDIGGS